jgi:hypothetical protein
MLTGIAPKETKRVNLPSTKVSGEELDAVLFEAMWGGFQDEGDGWEHCLSWGTWSAAPFLPISMVLEHRIFLIRESSEFFFFFF